MKVELLIEKMLASMSKNDISDIDAQMLIMYFLVKVEDEQQRLKEMKLCVNSIELLKSYFAVIECQPKLKAELLAMIPANKTNLNSIK